MPEERSAVRLDSFFVLVFTEIFGRFPGFLIVKEDINDFWNWESYKCIAR